MNKILESIKAFWAKAVSVVSDKIDGEKLRRFFLKNGKYFVAVLLVVILVLVLYRCTGPEAAGNTQDTEEGQPTTEFVLDEQFEQDAHEDVNALIIQYYTDYAAGNVDEMETYAYPISDNEKSYIGLCSQYQESYQNISCYTKTGLTEGSYFVSVCYDLKFYEVETAAPGLDFFYVETDENGALYINNLYSGYNRERMEEEMDAEVYAAYVQYRQQEDLQVIREEVQQRYQDALSTDVNLVNMLSTVFPDAVENWKNTVLAIEESEAGTENTEAVPEDTQAEPVTEAQETQEEQQEEAVPEEVPVVQVRTTGNSLNVRSEASADSASLGKVEKGTVFTKLGESGEWTQIDYNGTPAYIKTEYVQEVTNE
jgi:hypothetical protein